ncbi:MAG: HTH-like domain-containing protein [Pseudomonadota bacterium]
MGSSASQVAIAAGISEKYGTELRKGMKLARYVTLKIR